MTTPRIILLDTRSGHWTLPKIELEVPGPTAEALAMVLAPPRELSLLDGKAVADVALCLRTAIRLVRLEYQDFMCLALEAAGEQCGRYFQPAHTDHPRAAIYWDEIVEGLTTEIAHHLGDDFDKTHAPARNLPRPEHAPDKARRARLKVMRKVLRQLCPKNSEAAAKAKVMLATLKNKLRA